MYFVRDTYYRVKSYMVEYLLALAPQINQLITKPHKDVRYYVHGL